MDNKVWLSNKVGIEDIEDLKEDFKRVIEGDDENGKSWLRNLKKRRIYAPETEK